MSWNQTDLDRLEAAIAKGVRAVQYDGQRVEYATLQEMLTARDRMRAALGLGTQATYVAGFRRGL